MLKFAVNKDGSMSDISVVENSLSSLNLNAISNCLSSANAPRWRPATQNGHPVKTYFTKGVNIQ